MHKSSLCHKTIRNQGLVCQTSMTECLFCSIMCFASVCKLSHYQESLITKPDDYLHIHTMLYYVTAASRGSSHIADTQKLLCNPMNSKERFASAQSVKMC